MAVYYNSSVFVATAFDSYKEWPEDPCNELEKWDMNAVDPCSLEDGYPLSRWLCLCPAVSMYLSRVWLFTAHIYVDVVWILDCQFAVFA